MTLTFKDGTKTVGETVFHTTNYSSTVLPVNLENEVPDLFPADQYTLSGKTIKGVTIQCIVEGAGYSKQVKTNNTGEFSFKIPTETDGNYRIHSDFPEEGICNQTLHL